MREERRTHRLPAAADRTGRSQDSVGASGPPLAGRGLRARRDPAARARAGASYVESPCPRRLRSARVRALGGEFSAESTGRNAGLAGFFFDIADLFLEQLDVGLDAFHFG